MSRFLTTQQVAEIVGEGPWTVRRVVDGLGKPIERFGAKRMIPPDMLPEIAEAIRNRKGRKNQRAVPCTLDRGRR